MIVKQLKMNTLFYNIQNDSSFVKNDRQIILNNYNVIDFVFSQKSKILTPFTFFHQLVQIILYWNKYHIILSQIAGYHTLIPSLLSYLKLKKHIIILHGTDCNIIPEIGYGNLQKPVLKWFTKQSILKANLLLPVSHSLVDNKSEYYTENKISLGLRKNIVGFNTPYTIIHNAVEADKFRIITTDREPFTFITVAFGLEKKKNVLLKGVDLIIDLAKKNPEYTFTILGSNSIYNYKNDLKNVTIIPKVAHNKLIDYYNQNKYYLQLSISESFGLSLCEAMLCGCIPIVSDVGIMPEIVEDKGFILMSRDQVQINNLLHTICQDKKEIDQFLIRELILKKYSFPIRREKLLFAIHHLTSNKSP